MKPKGIFLFCVGIVFLIVLFQNMDVVSFKFLFFKVSMSRIILFPLVMFAGGLIGFMLGKKSNS